MFRTAEVRWFYEGQIPPQVLDWFRQDAETLNEQPPRVDHYLHLGDMDSLGIKLREGRFEIKQRRRQYGPTRFQEQVAGQVEGWRKWSLALAEQNPAPLSVPAACWVAVRKERLLRLYRIGRAGEVVALPAGQYPARGCGIELTTVRVEGREWWSLGFEAHGEGSPLRKDLTWTVKEVLARGLGCAFEVADSYGYPRLLKALR